MREKKNDPLIDERAREKELHLHLLDFLRMLAREVVRRLAEEQNKKPAEEFSPPNHSED